MAEINQGLYDIQAQRVYVTSDNYMWEYKWFYYKNYSGSEKVYVLAHEYKTNTSYTFPISGNDVEFSGEIIERLNERTELLKNSR